MARKDLSSPLDENGIVHLLRERFEWRSASVIKGIGDDGAVVLPRGAEEYWVLTSDMLLENIDFRRSWTTPEQLGHKSLAVNLSDLAAMGSRPRFYTVALGIPEGISRKWIAAFYQGMTSLGATEGALLVGGDLSRSEVIYISITALGETLHRKVLYRSGVRAGDLLYVTGTLGKSAAGLRLLESGHTHPKTRSQRQAIRAHRMPQPRCNVGLWLAQSGLVSGMMDLSDGLSMDLPRMCTAGETGAEIYAPSLPLFLDSAAWRCDPLELALHGGEDFELLFAVPRRSVSRFKRSYPGDFPKATQIGRLTDDRGVAVIAGPGQPPKPLPLLGFDHFQRK